MSMEHKHEGFGEKRGGLGWLVGGLKRQANPSDVVGSKRVLRNRTYASQNSAVKMPVWLQCVRQISEDRDRAMKMRPHDRGWAGAQQIRVSSGAG